MIEIGDKVIAIKSRDDTIQAGLLYIVEAVEHPSLGKCGLIKLYGVRDYWSSSNFVKISKELLDRLDLKG